MSSITLTVARQYRLQEWAFQIRECHNRPQNLTVKGWNRAWNEDWFD